MRVKPVRYQNQPCLHFITFSGYRRMNLLDSVGARDTFERELERVRLWYGFYITGYVREQFFLAAVAQNIKRLARFLSQPTTPALPATT